MDVLNRLRLYSKIDHRLLLMLKKALTIEINGFGTEENVCKLSSQSSHQLPLKVHCFNLERMFCPISHWPGGLV